MTAVSSLDLDHNLRLISTKSCQACGLYRNQLPLFDTIHNAQVFWVGLSAVRTQSCHESQPLSPDTKSGALIGEIEKPLSDQLTFYKTNLVKCLPLKNDRIRYPNQGEMKKCSSKFEMELRTLNPSLVFLLGKQVASFILRKYLNKEAELDKAFDYKPYHYNGIYLVPIHHPSYMLVYKRKYIQDYIRSIRSLCGSIQNTNIFSGGEVLSGQNPERIDDIL